MVALFFEALGIVQRGHRVVDRAGADDDQQPVIFAVHDVLDALAGGGDQGFHRRAADREKTDQMFGGRQHGNVLDTFVVGNAGAVGAGGHCRFPLAGSSKK